MPESLRPFAVALIIFACTFAAALFGILLRKKLPQHHLSADSKEVINLVMGLIATMVALVLGLLVASAKSSYGPTRARHARGFARLFWLRLQKMWLKKGAEPEARSVHIQIAPFFESIGSLSPNNEAQRFIQKRALDLLIST